VYVRGGQRGDRATCRRRTRSAVCASLGAVNGRSPAVVPRTTRRYNRRRRGPGSHTRHRRFVSEREERRKQDQRRAEVYVGGPAANAADQIKIFKGIDSPCCTHCGRGEAVLLDVRAPGVWLLPIGRGGGDDRGQGP